MNIVYNYPVYRVAFAMPRRNPQLTVIKKRELFLAGNYTVGLRPLNPFQQDMTWLTCFPDGWGAEIMQVVDMSDEDRKSEATFRTWARGPDIALVPYPTNEDGDKMCHGSILNFNERPVHLHSNVALQRWLKARNASVCTQRDIYLGNWPHCNPNPPTQSLTHSCTHPLYPQNRRDYR